MFMLHHFDTVLPENFSEFNQIIQSYFPQVFDTKYLSIYGNIFTETIPAESTNLEDLYRFVCKNVGDHSPKIILTDGFERFKNGEFLHEGGYDAYLTGCIFAIFQQKITQNSTTETLSSQKNLVNKLFLMKSVFVWSLDSMCLPLGIIFHVIIPKDFILADFERILLGHPPFKVLWIDEVSVFLVFQENGENAKMNDGIGMSLVKAGLVVKTMEEFFVNSD